MNIKEAIILAGGKGTRLKSLVADIPKPLAPINNIPFLTLLIRYLKTQGIQRVILSVGYKWELIKNEYGNKFEDIDIDYSIEETPLGTGGGIAKALKIANDQDILILNGDSFCKIDIEDFYLFHHSYPSYLSIGIKEMENFSRYGSIEINQDKIIAFNEKKFIEKGYINTGVYIANKDLFSNTLLGDKFSFEEEFLCPEVIKGNFYGYKTNSYFIDIGIPEDYRKAEIELIKMIDNGN